MKKTWASFLCALAASGFIVWPGLSFADNQSISPEQKTKFAQFQRENEAHISRVARLSDVLFARFGGRCVSVVPRDVALGFFALHDDNKKHSPGLMFQIFQFYGQSDSAMGERDYEKLQSLKGELNRRDNLVNINYLARNGFAEPMTHTISQCGDVLIKMTEIADHIDRAMSPQAELEWGEPKFSESFYLMNTPAQQIAIFGEQIYPLMFPEQRRIAKTCVSTILLPSARTTQSRAALNTKI